MNENLCKGLASQDPVLFNFDFDFFSIKRRHHDITLSKILFCALSAILRGPEGAGTRANWWPLRSNAKPLEALKAERKDQRQPSPGAEQLAQSFTYLTIDKAPNIAIPSFV